MIQLLYQGEVALFLIILLAIVISLSFHEFGHAFVAKLYGDDTAQRAGRLTLNPLAHLDPMGLLMVVLVGFGYAKPVPTDPRKFNSRWAHLFISAAGPGMNLLVATIAFNFFTASIHLGWIFMASQGPALFFTYLARINLILLLFNLIPLGALDGHYILPYFLTRKWAAYYQYYNARYGNVALLGLVMLSFIGVPVFRFVWSLSGALLPMISFF